MNGRIDNREILVSEDDNLPTGRMLELAGIAQCEVEESVQGLVDEEIKFDRTVLSYFVDGVVRMMLGGTKGQISKWSSDPKIINGFIDGLKPGEAYNKM